jgi:HSP20 family protein
MQTPMTPVAVRKVPPSREVAREARSRDPFGSFFSPWLGPSDLVGSGFDAWLESPRTGWPSVFSADEDRLLAPRLDVVETDDAFLVSTELPGLKKDDVKVEFEAGVLSISGEKTEAREEKDATLHRRERRYGAFRRAFALPRFADGEKAEAKLADGVLEVRIPKKEEARPRPIRVV